VAIVEQGLALTARTVQDEAEWDALREDWNQLYASSPAATPALDFFWLRNWWRVYGPSFRQSALRVLTIWRDARLIGAMPLYLCSGGALGIRRLRFISTGEPEGEETCPDYMNLLYAPDEADACVAVAWKAIAEIGWDYLELLDLPADSPLLKPTLRPAYVQPFARGTCPIADLSGGFEAYLKRLSSHGRQHARQVIREKDKAGAQFDIIEPTEANAAFEELIKLHQERWLAEGKPGAFAAATFIGFHRNLVREWLPEGRLVLARLSLGSAPVALLYGFLNGQKFDFYQSGIDQPIRGSLSSPGKLINLLLMKALSERGVTAYDFLRGASFYKERLATRENSLVGVRVWHFNARTALYRSGMQLGRVLRRMARLVRMRKP
jgi:CelD/BcsL family acetyltransferase involved in cellulose biosynthesis